jgi:4-amino-4-deoxy-L-arabinose transferase-like glycosyltransferase
VGLVAILLLAAALRLAYIDSLGYVNHYYAAAVKSMLQSWHNFFFIAAEPGGSVSVDKPPLGLWLQAISAYFLGVNSIGLLMPQILAGLASVVVVYHLVQRSFGTLAGLLAALALAVTPVVVAIDRNNTMDSTMILTLLLAAWAFIKATENGRLRYLLLGSVLVGLAFNIKMLAAFLPVPAFFALYFLGAPGTAWRKIGKLALAGVLLLVVSLSWAVAVDLTPADQRPYVGSSGDNSELALIIGYNGVNRLLGMSPNGGAPGGTPANNLQQPGFPQDGSAATPGNFQNPPPQGMSSQSDGQTPPVRPQDGNGGPPGNRPGGGGGPFNIGQAGPLRLFTSPLNKEASWLLPVGIMSILLVLGRTRLKWPLASRHQALVLWGGWLLVSAVFFSMASFFHEYYLSLLGAPLAALVGIGITELWEMRKDHPLLASILALVTGGATIGFQVYTAQSFVTSIAWLPYMLGAFLAGALLLVAVAKDQIGCSLAVTGFALVILSIYITPAIWSGYTATNAGDNLSLPAAYSGRSGGPSNRGNEQVNDSLLNYLEANTQDTDYLVAVPSSMQGSDYVLATGRPVLYLGGFNGNDAVASADDLAQMVKDGSLRYIYWGSQGMGNKSDISTWLASSCTIVTGFDTTTRNFGAPDGTTKTSSIVPNGPGGNQPITLYDCRNG